MKTPLLIGSSILWLLAFAFADDRPQYASCLDYIQKTGRLWGVCEVSLNADRTVTLVDAKTSGYGHALTMLTSEGKGVDRVTLSPSQFCDLSAGYPGRLRYELQSVKDGLINLAVTERFHVPSVGHGLKEQKASVSVKPYRDEKTNPQQDGPANGSQPTRSVTNATSSAAGAQHSTISSPVGREDRLAIGDKILVFFDDPPIDGDVRMEAVIAPNGTARLFFNLELALAGLTLSEARAAIRDAYTPKYFRVFPVRVIKVQPSSASDVSQPTRSETNSASPAAGSRR